MKNTNCDCVQTFDKTKLSTWSILGLKNQYFSVATVWKYASVLTNLFKLNATRFSRRETNISWFTKYFCKLFQVVIGFCAKHMRAKPSSRLNLYLLTWAIMDLGRLTFVSLFQEQNIAWVTKSIQEKVNTGKLVSQIMTSRILKCF
jgi:hypothetical protein